jgi:CHAT domain-containing protein
MKRSYNKRLSRFVIPIVMTALLCITSPNLTKFATASSPPLQSTPSFDQQAKSNYTNQNFSEAAKLFQQAAQGYKAAGNPIQQALSLSNLSLTYQQLGQWNEAKQAIDESLSILKSLPETASGRSLALAQAIDIQGSLLLARGQTNQALTVWEQATTLYQKQGKPERALMTQTNQAKALQNMGLYRRAIELLDKALSLKSRGNPEPLKAALQKVPGSIESANALKTLGESLRIVGDFPQAILVLDRSLAIATDRKASDTITLAQLSLGNTYRAQGFEDDKRRDSNRQKALQFYQQAASSSSAPLRVQAKLNQISLLVDGEQTADAQKLIPSVQQEMGTLPPNRAAIDARINLAQTMMRMKGDVRPIAQSLAIAVQQSKALGDPRTQAYALGSLGRVYEQTKQWNEAETLTKQALQLAQQINAGDVAYRWQWQLGRILNAQGKNQDAIIAYQEAVTTIRSLRADLAASSPDVQFSFRVAIEPIHRQLVSLLLKSEQPERLKSARKVIEDLQLVELDNFFREACLNADPTLVDRVDKDAAVIYPILLDDQLSVIVSLPGANDNLRYFKTNVSRQQVEELATSLRSELDQGNTLKLTLPMLQQVYDWLLRPAMAEISTSQAKTLVFVLDGALRNVPMAALHNGKQFLIENYSVAITPGLQLLSPQRLSNQRLGALVGGLAQARDEFPALPAVKNEVQKIEAELPSRVLFDQKFTTSAFQSSISQASFPIVHLATHGKFSSRAEDTFILTWDGRLKVADLSGVLQTVDLARERSLELLVLSACETAEGDPQSALGLAGVAVRSGARSTVATLWRVNDEASASLMEQFYNELAQVRKTRISKAEALRRAQLSILRNPKYGQQPFFWAAYVLIGNWT